MVKNFFVRKKQFLVFSALQAAFWVILFWMIYTTLRIEHPDKLPLISSLREVIVQMVLVYVHYLVIIPRLNPTRVPARYLLVVTMLIVLASATNILAESIIIGTPTIQESLLGTAVLSAGLLILSAPLKWSYEYFILRHQQQELASTKMEAELKYLRLQINPHFLFNTLNNIYYLAEQKSGKTAPAIAQLSDLMRYLLEKNNRDKVPLQKEIDFIQAYLELEKMRVSGMALNFETEGDITNQMIPPMLILPLVENAFKHGIDKRMQNNELDICIKISNRLHLIIDNTVSATVAPQRISTGGGIANLKKRLNLHFPRDHQLHSEMKNNIFHAELDIPLL